PTTVVCSLSLHDALPIFNVLLVIQAVAAMAQTPGKITGRVVDSKSQRPMANVIVSVQNTILSVTTDPTGQFTIENVDQGDKLVSDRKSTRLNSSHVKISY